MPWYGSNLANPARAVAQEVETAGVVAANVAAGAHFGCTTPRWRRLSVICRRMIEGGGLNAHARQQARARRFARAGHTGARAAEAVHDLWHCRAGELLGSRGRADPLVERPPGRKRGLNHGFFSPGRLDLRRRRSPRADAEASPVGG